MKGEDQDHVFEVLAEGSQLLYEVSEDDSPAMAAYRLLLPSLTAADRGQLRQDLDALDQGDG
jgi:hypothetical protein